MTRSALIFTKLDPTIWEIRLRTERAWKTRQCEWMTIGLIRKPSAGQYQVWLNPGAGWAAGSPIALFVETRSLEDAKQSVESEMVRRWMVAK